jgi:hypothetical protein
MSELTIDDFSGHVGAAYEIEAGGGTVSLTLEEARPLPTSVREAGSFALLFRGPADPVLPQSIYSFRRGGDGADIFITPVARDTSGTQYEAIFN